MFISISAIRSSYGADIKRLVDNCSLSIASKIVNAFIGLITLPLLLSIYGKSSYGLVIIAVSINAFWDILQLGLPTGLPKFVAEWYSRKILDENIVALNTVFTLYVILCVANVLIISIISYNTEVMFKIGSDSITDLSVMILIGGVGSLILLPSNIIDQLLIGVQELSYISMLEIAKNISLLIIVMSIYYGMIGVDIITFYIVRTLLPLIYVPLKYLRWKKYSKEFVFKIGLNFKSIKPLLGYCLSLMVLAIFVALAEKLRPIFLGIRVTENVSATLADYEVINNVRMFIVLIVSSLMLGLIPYISTKFAKGDKYIYSKMIYKGTKLSWSCGALIGLLIIISSKELLTIYVGTSNLYLNDWLVLYLGASLYYLYSAPITCTILSSGKTVPLAIATSVACFSSLLVCWGLAPSFGVGAAVISLCVYNLVHFIISHFWYLPHFFGLSIKEQLFDVLLPPLISCLIVHYSLRYMSFGENVDGIYLRIVIVSVIASFMYVSLLIFFNWMRSYGRAV